MKPYQGSIQDDPNFRILFENSVMVVGHVYETAWCCNKFTKEEFGIYEFENDPTCALVGKNNDWCLVGGDVLVLKTWVDNTLRIVGTLKDIYALKPIHDYCIQILIDPWTENAAIWQLEIDLKLLSRPISLVKVKDIKAYIDRPYTDHVDW